MLNAVKNLCRPTDLKVLNLLFKLGTKVYLSSTKRKEHLVELGITQQAYTNSITRLKQHGILTSAQRGIYIINLGVFINTKHEDINIEIHGINSTSE